MSTPNFISVPYGDWRPLRLLLACTGAAVSCGALLSVLFHVQMVRTTPVELMGCIAYASDINISNRFFTIFLAMVMLPLLAHAGAYALSVMKTTEGAATRALFLCFAPLAFFLATTVFSPEVLEREWIFLATMLYWSGLLLFWLESANPERARASGIILAGMVLSSFLPAAFAFAAKAALYYAAPDILLKFSAVAAKLLSISALALPLGVFVLGVLLKTRRNAVIFLLFPIQLGLLLMLFSMLPRIWETEGAVFPIADLKRSLLVLVVPCFAVGCAETIWRTFSRRDGDLSPFSVVALAALFSPLFFGEAGLAVANFFETGARISPFVAVHFDDLKLFRDCLITYGLWDYLGLWLDAFLQGGPPTYFGVGGFPAIHFAVTLFLMGLASVLFHPAFAVALCVLYMGSQTALIGGLLLVFLTPFLLKKPAWWIALWLSLASFLPFFRLPQGIFFVVCTGPLFLWQMVVLWKESRQLFLAAVVAVAVLAGMFLVWPFADYFYGLFRIVTETGKVNAPWAANTAYFDRYPLVLQIVGNGVILLPLLAMVAAAGVWRFGRDGNLRHREAFALVSVVCLYILCSFSYSFSRIDNGIARQLATMLTLFLPMMVILLYIKPGRGLTGCCIVSLGLLALHGKFPEPPRKLAAEAATIPRIDDTFVDGESMGLPALGRGFYEKKEELEEIAGLKKSLDAFLEPQETFLNLSMNGIQYLMGRRSPLEHSSYFNFTGDKPQFRALRELESARINSAVFGREIFDESAPPQRTYHLYRHAVLSMLPCAVSENFILMVPPQRIAERGMPIPSRHETVSLFEDFYSGELQELCAVWGRGVESFQKDFTSVETVRVESLSPGRAEVRFDQPVDGSGQGLLLLKADRDAGKVRVTWENEFGTGGAGLAFNLRKGWNIVPLDSFPRWLLAESNQSLKISAEEGELSIVEARIAQRYLPEGSIVSESLPTY